MRRSLVAFLVALTLPTAALATPVFQYHATFSDGGAGSATAIVTMALYDFPLNWGEGTVCGVGGCDANAIITDISFTGMSPDVAHAWGTSGGIGLTFAVPGDSPTYTNYFKLTDAGVIDSGDFTRWSPCDLDCVHLRLGSFGGNLFAAHATFAGGIIDEVYLPTATIDPTPVPEPASLILLASGIGMAVRKLRPAVGRRARRD